MSGAGSPRGRAEAQNRPTCTPRGFAAGELKHGPIALIEEGLPVIVVMPSPTNAAMLHAKLLSNIREIQARARSTIVIAEEGDETVRPYADHIIEIPAVSTLFQPLLSTVLLRVFAASVARARLRRRQAAQPGQVRHRRIGGVSIRYYVTAEQIRSAEGPLLAALPDGALMRRAATGLASVIAAELRRRTGASRAGNCARSWALETTAVTRCGRRPSLRRRGRRPRRFCSTRPHPRRGPGRVPAAGGWW